MIYDKKIFLFILLFTICIFSPFFLTYFAELMDPWTIDVSQRHHSPSVEHPFGTDSLGRSLLARTTYSLSLALSIAFKACLVLIPITIILGGLAGFYLGGFIDDLISWLISVILTVPFVLWVIALAAALNPDIDQIHYIIGLVAWAAPTRIVRTEVARLYSTPFVRAERAQGMTSSRLFVRSIVPFVLGPVLISIFSLVPEIITVDLALSFFGLGAKPPIPTLGYLIYEGFDEVNFAWWSSMFPTISLLITLGILIFIGRFASSLFMR